MATRVDMGNNNLVVVLCDVDGTLCNARYLAASLVSYQFKKPTRIPRAVIYLITQTARLLFYKAGLLTYASIVKASAPDFARLLKGLSKSEAFSLFSKAALKAVNTAREDMLVLLKWHQEKGNTIVLVSGGFQPFVQEVARLLEIRHTVGTALEEVSSHYTGCLVGPFCHGDDRVNLVHSFIKASRFNVNLPLSFAYGDRAQDIPMLEMVGHPVAVYPDKELLKYAKERGWAVIGEYRK
jgi:HAD superfamily hydrolase (TIGR01490 family)